MSKRFDIEDTSLESSVKAYHKRVMESVQGEIDELEKVWEVLENFVLKKDLDSASVKYAEEAGSIDWEHIKNIPEDIGSSSPGASGHTHSNKTALDKLTENDIAILKSIYDEYLQYKETIDPDITISSFIENRVINSSSGTMDSWGTF